MKYALFALIVVLGTVTAQFFPGVGNLADPANLAKVRAHANSDPGWANRMVDQNRPLINQYLKSRRNHPIVKMITAHGGGADALKDAGFRSQLFSAAERMGAKRG